jgi:DNA polymerase phi
MAKSKRAQETESAAAMDDVHTSRKKRMKYSDDDAALANIYSDLADEVQDVRLKAAGELIKNLSVELPDKTERQDAAEKRLIKGLCSGRKAARLGFSVALAELIRLRTRSTESEGSHRLLQEILRLTTPQGNVSGQERRDYLLGRRFAFQAVLQSDIALQKDFPDEDWDKIVQMIFDLATEKPWLRRECGSMLFEYLDSRGLKLRSSKTQMVIEVASERNMLKTPEGVGIWLLVQGTFPGVKLPKGTWNHDNPLSSKERPALSKMLLEDVTGDETSIKKAGTRQSNPSFVWKVILSNLLKLDETKPFEKFWDICIASTMFSSTSSTERKSLGLQIVSLALSMARASHLAKILHSNILRCILDQRADSDRYLFEAAKGPLNRTVALAKKSPSIAGIMASKLLFDGAINFDQLSKTKTIESLIIHANDDALAELARVVVKAIRNAGIDIGNGAETGNRQRLLADIMLMMVRSHTCSRTSLPDVLPSVGESSETWLQSILYALSEFAYHDSLPPSTRTIMRTRLMSCLNNLIDAPLREACIAPVITAWHALKESDLLRKDNEHINASVQNAKACLKKSYGPHSSDPSSQAFSLLFALGILQVFNGEPDAVAILEDLAACYSAKDASTDSTAMLVELLLSFISKPSSLFRKLAEQVFSVLAPDITAESLQSLVDILAQKESLSGQRELFDEHSDGNEQQNGDDEDGEAMDVEDASDVEVVNGEDPSEEEDSDDYSAGSSSAEEGAANPEDDEEAAFDKKLADALGTIATEDDSEDDGSDMDDEQMMALEPHLTTIFKERKQKSSQKQEKKDAKDNIINFKNRVLDLLTIYVKAQSGSPLTLDLLLPLTGLLRTTISKQTAEKSFAVLRQYFESCNKNKALPQPDDHESCFVVLAELHEEMKLGGSKLHANACSRSSLFLAKILVAIDRRHYQRIAEMYAQLQSDWYSDPKSKMQGSVFTEWISWSISTRKQ